MARILFSRHIPLFPSFCAKCGSSQVLHQLQELRGTYYVNHHASALEIACCGYLLDWRL